MITVEKLYDVLNEMGSIYPFNDATTVIRLNNNPCRMEQDVVCIETVDNESGIKITMEKEANVMLTVHKEQI